MRAVVEFIYAYEVEVPEDATQDEVMEAADKLHQQDIDETDLMQPSHIEVTYLNESEETP